MKSKSDTKSIRILTVINIAGSILSVVYGILQARFFGVTRVIEVYFVATTLVYTILSLTQTGQLIEMFLPIYHRIKQSRGNTIAQEAFCVLLNWVIGVVTLLCIVFWWFSPIIVDLITPGFATGDKQLANDIFRVFIPFLLLDVANNMFIMYFNAERSYGRSESIGVLNTVISILLLIFTYDYLGIWALVLSMWVGKLFQLLSFIIMLTKHKFKYSLTFSSAEFEVRPLLRGAYSTMFYVTTTQTYIFILNSAATLLPAGSYAVFKYVQQLYVKTNGVIMRPISIVSFTAFSKLVATDAPLNKIRSKVSEAINQTTFAAILIAVIIVVAGKYILSFLWGGDKFGPGYIELAYILLCVYFLLLFFSGFSQVYRKLVVSCGYTYEQYIAASVIQILTAIVAYFMIKHFEIIGLAVTIAFNTIGLTIVSLAIIGLKKKELLVLHNIGKLAKIIVSFIITVFLSNVTSSYLNISVAEGVNRSFNFMMASTISFFAILSFFFSSLILKLEEAEILWEMMKSLKAKIYN